MSAFTRNKAGSRIAASVAIATMVGGGSLLAATTAHADEIAPDPSSSAPAAPETASDPGASSSVSNAVVDTTPAPAPASSEVTEAEPTAAPSPAATTPAVTPDSTEPDANADVAVTPELEAAPLPVTPPASVGEAAPVLSAVDKNYQVRFFLNAQNNVEFYADATAEQVAGDTVQVIDLNEVPATYNDGTDRTGPVPVLSRTAQVFVVTNPGQTKIRVTNSETGAVRVFDGPNVNVPDSGGIPDVGLECQFVTQVPNFLQVVFDGCTPKNSNLADYTVSVVDSNGNIVATVNAADGEGLGLAVPGPGEYELIASSQSSIEAYPLGTVTVVPVTGNPGGNPGGPGENPGNEVPAGTQHATIDNFTDTVKSGGVLIQFDYTLADGIKATTIPVVIYDADGNEVAREDISVSASGSYSNFFDLEEGEYKVKVLVEVECEGHKEVIKKHFEICEDVVLGTRQVHEVYVRTDCETKQTITTYVTFNLAEEFDDKGNVVEKLVSATSSESIAPATEQELANAVCAIPTTPSHPGEPTNPGTVPGIPVTGVPVVATSVVPVTVKQAQRPIVKDERDDLAYTGPGDIAGAALLGGALLGGGGFAVFSSHRRRKANVSA